MVWQTIGFDKNKKLFEVAMKDGLFGHAYIFSGQEMIGKKTFAIELANFVTGNKQSEYNPDVLVVCPASSESGQSITIEEVRKIKDLVALSPYAAQYKFIIIDDAHLMTLEAQNAILKVLEEPNASSILILVTACPEALLPTIFSRCQEVGFFPHASTLIKNIIVDTKLSKINRDFLTEFASGRIGLVKRVVEDNSFVFVEDSIKKIMHLAKADLNERLEAAQKLTDEKNKANLPQLILYWTLYLRTRLDEPRAQKMLRGLLVLNEIVNKPQYNQRLALENFLVSL